LNVLTTVLFLHVLAAATWLGAALWTPGDVRRTLARGKPHADLLSSRALPAVWLDVWAGVATFVTGAAAVGLQGGRPRVGIMVGMVAVLVRLALAVLVLLPAWKAVGRAVGAGDLTAAQRPAKRMAMCSGVGHLLWVVALAGMVFTF
jgi:hypothetical protein